MNAITPLFLTLLLSACTAVQKPELECDNTRDRPFPTYFMLKAIGSLLNVNN